MNLTPLPQTTELASTLLQAGLTIAVAESLTGGAVAAELASVPGISGALVGGVVAYATPLKHTLLGVDEELLDRRGAVDGETAVAMAAAARVAMTIDERVPDIGVATTGVAGPSAQEGKPVGTVFVGIDSLFGSHVVQLDFSSLVVPGDDVTSRNRIRQATVEAAIFNVSEFLARQ
ncbi:CinA family protein [Pseudoclavibacter chungangensis]|uniref:CinA family protein n=1 Tax=Pseudoclavibacter chungangensis TaxID=587635 RepID=A0A7J5BNG0_9MICO|nr:CinA family protein [Pseudoclavibacter chungangensis]KAB1653094.1 CinA family protein [Pseudoclavibacter chungangensis]NYJ67018.1 nicotinamide-nucleotide amidase [Pseudoclavibacter chungangensis]